MKALKVIGIAISLVIIILAIVVAFLSPKSHMERSILVNSEPEAIFKYLDNFKAYNQWSPWSEIDPATIYQFDGPESGPGARMSWSSKDEQVGEGEQWIIEMRENEYVKYGMKFGGFEGDFSAEIILEPTINETKVTWTYNGDVSKAGMFNAAMGKFFGMFMDSMLGPFYEKGLYSLKEQVENTPPAVLLESADTISVAQ
ncbi:MAG TPA: hypothetical protein DIS90_10000 [Cytophagales bacterium]|nr:hypothetical protein [Cytophagales bacterium]